MTKRIERRKVRVLVPLGEGGHSKELLRLVSLLGSKYEYHYLMVKEDSMGVEKLPVAGKVWRCNRPHLKEKHQWKALFGYGKLLVQSLAILARARPDALIHVGPAMTIPVSILCRFFKIPIVFIETGSRVHTSSKTGAFMHGKADIYFVQWPELQKEKLPDAVHAGLLL